jgi:hypothetical protein
MLHRQDLRPHIAKANCQQSFRNQLNAAMRVLIRRASAAGLERAA